MAHDSGRYRDPSGRYVQSRLFADARVPDFGGHVAAAGRGRRVRSAANDRQNGAYDHSSSIGRALHGELNRSRFERIHSRKKLESWLEVLRRVRESINFPGLLAPVYRLDSLLEDSP